MKERGGGPEGGEGTGGGVGGEGGWHLGQKSPFDQDSPRGNPCRRREEFLKLLRLLVQTVGGGGGICIESSHCSMKYEAIPSIFQHKIGNKSVLKKHKLQCIFFSVY